MLQICHHEVHASQSNQLIKIEIKIKIKVKINQITTIISIKWIDQ